jgi:hypothetical protein
MRPLDELIDLAEPGWPLVEGWLAEATNSVELLPADPERAAEVLTLLQVTTRSPMGAIAHQSGGLIVDGWLRVLGGGGPRMKGDLANWNGLGEDPLFHVEGALVVALDPVGGVFAIGRESRHVAYFSPDCLEWQDLELGYSDFLQSMLRSDLDEFFTGLRWDGWRAEVAAITLDQGIHSWPPLWSRESKESEPSRKAVPLREVVGIGFDTARQM